MLTFRQYLRPQTLDEAYALCQKRANLVLGGMLWLKMQNRTVDTVIDLCDLGLDQVEDLGEEWRIGAMVPLRALETHPGLAQATHGAMADCLCHIVGVQFRNLATVGGSIYGRFGFSDPLTLFLALGAVVELHHAGEVPLADFVNQPYTRDILTHIRLPKHPGRVAYLAQRNTATDFPVLTCAVAVGEGGARCAIGDPPHESLPGQAGPARGHHPRNRRGGRGTVWPNRFPLAAICGPGRTIAGPSAGFWCAGPCWDARRKSKWKFA